MSTSRHLALTGNIASGKSTVAALLAARGALVIDADHLAREAVAPGTDGFDAVVEQFGPSIIAPNGTLDRTALRVRVFSDPSAREALNAIVHPRVRKLRDEAVREAMARGEPLIISDIPLLFEIGLEQAFDGVILVDAPEGMRRERLVRHRGLSPDAAQAMIDVQWPSTTKRARSHWVIDNDGTTEALRARVDAIWPQLSGPDWPPPLPQPASGADTSP